MLLTVALLVAAALCQGVTGYWAFHLSTESLKARIGFASITAIAVGLLVWTGVRAYNDSEKLQARVGAGFSGLHTDITGLRAAVTQKPTIIVQTPQIQQTAPIKHPLPHAEVKVTRMEFVPVSPDDGTGDMIARIRFQNLGDFTGYSPAEVGTIFIGEPIPQKKFDETMGVVREAALKLRPPRNAEMIPKGIESYWDVARIKATDWTAINSGKQTFYAWVILSSVDENTPKKSAFFFEFAAVKSGGPEYTITRNLGYFHVLKSPQ